MIKIAVVDDEKSERLKIRECLRFMETADVKFDVSEFGSAEEFLIKYEPVYDIVLMDIQLGQTNGLEAAKALRKTDKTVIIIFVTNMAQLAVRGYEVDALDFIVKPLDKLVFALKFKRALVRVSSPSSAKIIIKQDGELISVNAGVLRYIEVDGHYIIYHSPEGNHKEYITLSAAEKKLGSRGKFVRCNRGQLVNMRYVTAIKKDSVIVDGEELVLARTQKNAFVKAFADYIAGVKK